MKPTNPNEYFYTLTVRSQIYRISKTSIAMFLGDEWRELAGLDLFDRRIINMLSMLEVGSRQYLNNWLWSDLKEMAITKAQADGQR